jgi:hypothetical protein
MKKTRTVLMKIEWMIIVKGSTRGCGHRYVLRGHTPQGEFLRVETNPCSLSNQACAFGRRNPRVFEIVVREEGLATPIADFWETSESSGRDLEAEFASQQADFLNREQDHEQ